MTLSADGYDTDKAGFVARYERLLAPLREREVRLLELGVYHGGSLLMWRDYFPRGVIVGLDRDPIVLDGGERVHVYQGLQDDAALIDRIGRERAPDGFDLIIDDCAHLAAPARGSFAALFDRWLKPGGLYVVEDWGTGYGAEWADGKPYARDGAPGGHSAGMVGFVKELVDELRRGGPAYRLELSPHLAVLFKRPPR